jgi:hypothetical protein
MVTQFKQRQDEAKQAKSVAKKEEIARCLQLAVESRTCKNSEEYFVATQLFRSDYNRYIFSSFDTDEERLS